jgi:hypothetical protein
VAAELLVRLRKLNLISADDAKAIISAALVDLDELGEQLNRPRSLDEPSNDSARDFEALSRVLVAAVTGAELATTH